MSKNRALWVIIVLTLILKCGQYNYSYDSGGPHLPSLLMSGLQQIDTIRASEAGRNEMPQ